MQVIASIILGVVVFTVWMLLARREWRRLRQARFVEAFTRAIIKYARALNTMTAYFESAGRGLQRFAEAVTKASSK
jgi:hypothetical protein